MSIRALGLEPPNGSLLQRFPDVLVQQPLRGRGRQPQPAPQPRNEDADSPRLPKTEQRTTADRR